MARVMSEELSWWADLDEKLISLVFRDTTDNDYGWICWHATGSAVFEP